MKENWYDTGWGISFIVIAAFAAIMVLMFKVVIPIANRAGVKTYNQIRQEQLDDTNKKLDRIIEILEARDEQI